MRIRVANAPAGPETWVVEPLEFKSFSLNLDPDVELDAVRAAGGPVRLESDDRAWISYGWLREQEPYAGDASALEGLEKMVRFAREHGWVDDERDEIAAHVVREQANAGARPGG
jgi:hypothetical protein